MKSIAGSSYSWEHGMPQQFKQTRNLSHVDDRDRRAGIVPVEREVAIVSRAHTNSLVPKWHNRTNRHRFHGQRRRSEAPLKGTRLALPTTIHG